MVALTATFLLVFSLVLIAIGLVATARVRRISRARQSLEAATPAGRPAYRARSAASEYAPPAQPPAAPGYPPAPGSPYIGGADAGRYAESPATLYPGGMDAEAAEIERLKAEIALLKAHGGDRSAGFKRTQAMVAVAANVSGIIGLLVSVAALVK